MIKIKNLAEETYHFRKGGAAAVTTGGTAADGIVVPYNGWVKAIYCAFGKMGTDGTGSPTQDVIVDILKNGTSIFSGATKINFSHAKQVGTANTSITADNIGALSASPTAVAKGDFLRIDITQILNGTSPTQPTDLTLVLVFSRKAGASQPAGTLTGQIDEND